MSIQKLVSPHSIAVVGASDRPRSFGNNSALNSVRSRGIEDHVYYVNPNKEMLLGKKVYHSLGELPEIVDCLMVCVPRDAVLPILRQAAELGIKAAVVYASGFSEEGTKEGIALEQEMKVLAEKHGMSILGPNCAGMINNVEKRNLWGMGNVVDMDTRKTGIGIISQSGFVAANIMQRDCYDISYGVSAGNGNITTFEDILNFMVEDENVKVIALYLEGLKNARCFMAALKKAALIHKPIIVLKGGRSQKGAAAAASHTGNLAGSAKSIQAVFEKYGVIQVTSLEELMCMAQIFSVLDKNLPKSCGVAGINMSGGENTICADLCEDLGIPLPPLSDDTKDKMRAFIPSFATPNNPLDPTTALFGNKEDLIGLLQVFEEVPEIGSILVGSNVDISLSPIVTATCNALAESRERGCKKPVFVVPPFEATRNSEYRKVLESNGIVLTSSAKVSYTCIKKLLDFIKYDPSDHLFAESALEKSVESPAHTLSEFKSREALRDFGIPMPETVLITGEEDIQKACGVCGFPMVLKISSPDIAHKTDAGGVKLGIQNEEDALFAYREILSNCKNYKPDADIEGVMAAPMLPKGMEMILGITKDPVFGPMLLVGSGGVNVELFRDAVLSPCPINLTEAREMLSRLKVAKLLNGYRGSSPLDTEAFASLMVKISEYASVYSNEVKELDINPVFVYEKGKGTEIADALLVKQMNP